MLQTGMEPVLGIRTLFFILFWEFSQTFSGGCHVNKDSVATWLGARTIETVVSKVAVSRTLALRLEKSTTFPCSRI